MDVADGAGALTWVKQGLVWLRGRAADATCVWLRGVVVDERLRVRWLDQTVECAPGSSCIMPGTNLTECVQDPQY